MEEREAIPEIPLRMAPETSKAKALVAGNYGYQEAGDRHKLGGQPDWIQADETPDCPECSEAMEFYGQLDHLGSVEGLQDLGMIYVFLCRECYTTEAILQYS
ncbi:MAG: hypothetical protein ACRC8S_10985 [Fimbriiglobus sp.]